MQLHLHHLQDIVLRDKAVRIPASRIQEAEEGLKNGSLIIRRVHDDNDDLYELSFNAVKAEEIERIWTSDLPNKLTRIYQLCGSREPVAVRIFLERVEMGDLIPMDLRDWTEALWNKILVDGTYHESTGLSTIVLDKLVANGTLIYDCYDNYIFSDTYIEKARKNKKVSLDTAMETLSCYDPYIAISFMQAAGYGFNDRRAIFTRLDGSEGIGADFTQVPDIETFI